MMNDSSKRHLRLLSLIFIFNCLSKAFILRILIKKKLIYLTWSKLFGKLLIWFGCGNSKTHYYESLIINFWWTSISIPFFNFFITSIASPTEMRKLQNRKLIYQSVHGYWKESWISEIRFIRILILQVEMIRAVSIVT